MQTVSDMLEQVLEVLDEVLPSKPEDTDVVDVAALDSLRHAVRDFTERQSSACEAKPGTDVLAESAATISYSVELYIGNDYQGFGYGDWSTERFDVDAPASLKDDALSAYLLLKASAELDEDGSIAFVGMYHYETSDGAESEDDFDEFTEVDFDMAEDDGFQDAMNNRPSRAHDYDEGEARDRYLEGYAAGIIKRGGQG